MSAGFDPALGCPEGEQRVNTVLRKFCRDDDDDSDDDDDDGEEEDGDDDDDCFDR